MEISITDTELTAHRKLVMLNKRFYTVFLYLSIFFLILSPICLIAGYKSAYTNHSSDDGYHNYTDYHFATGLGIAALISGLYFLVFTLRFHKRMKQFDHSPTTYTFNESGIKASSETGESFIKWSALKRVHRLKGGYLISTNNYSCPTLLLLNSQISNDEIDWISNQIRKI